MIDKIINTVICGDCLEVMRDWPDNCVDLVLTDPPYGKQWARGLNAIGTSNQFSTKKEWLDWDKKRPCKEAFVALLRVSNNQIVWGGNYFWDYLFRTNCFLIWDKVDNFDNTTPFADCEMAWTSFSTVAKKFICRSRGFIRDAKEERQHPTQKPLVLMAWCVEKYSSPNDLILDPFCGSGTTCVAAKMLGRRYIGIDISEEYCKIARMRLKAVDTGVPVAEQRQGQQSLFEREGQ